MNFTKRIRQRSDEAFSLSDPGGAALAGIDAETDPRKRGDQAATVADPGLSTILGIKGPNPQPADRPSIPFLQPEDPVSTLIRPTEMPSLNSADSRRAKRRSLADQLARRGRMSTILTQSDDTLG